MANQKAKVHRLLLIKGRSAVLGARSPKGEG